MDLTKTLRILRRRWWLVIALAIIGAFVAWYVTNEANENRTAVVRAQTSIQFEPEEGETIASLTPTVRNTRDVAIIAAGDLLDEDPDLTILGDETNARVLFEATGASEEEAGEKAMALMQAYLDFEPTVGGAVDPLLQQLEQQAVELEQEIDELQAGATPAEQEIIDTHDFVDKKITAVEDEIVSLTIADAAADEEELVENQAERDRLNAILEELQAEKAALPPLPDLELDTTEELRLQSLQTRLAALSDQYQDLFLRQLGVTGGGVAQPVVFTDLTPDPGDPTLNAIIGFFAGIVIALVALTVAARTRKTIWLEEDIPTSVLATIPDRRAVTGPGPSWYDDSSPSVRKDSVQLLRTAIDGMLHQSPAVFAVGAHRVDSVMSHALAADLAASFSHAGRRVLLIDADFESPSELTEFDVGRRATLDEVLSLPVMSTEQLMERCSEMLSRAAMIRPELSVIPVGQTPVSPADAVAGRQFRAFLEAAVKEYDLVIAVGGETERAATQMLMQRLGTAVLVLAPGQTTAPRLEDLVADLEQQSIGFMGAVLVYGSQSESRRSKRAPISMPSPKPSSKPAQREGAPSPVLRLSTYPVREPKEGSEQPSPSMASLADEVVRDASSDESDVEAGDSLAAEILTALERQSPEESYEPVVQYVVQRTEDIFTARPGGGNVSDEVLSVIHEYGFVPLTPVPGHETLGERLRGEMHHEIGFHDGERLADQIETVLSRGHISAAGFDSWAREEFFVRHVENTSGEPVVWHIQSEGGTIHALVRGQGLDRQKLDLIASELAGSVRSQLEDDAARAKSEGDMETAERFESQAQDVANFQIALGWVKTGSVDDARIRYSWRQSSNQPEGWDPVWSEGVRPHLAPFQRLGLLAHPILADEELATTTLTG